MTKEDSKSGLELSPQTLIAGAVGGLIGLSLSLLLSPPVLGTVGMIFFGGVGLLLGASVTVTAYEVIHRLSAGESVDDLFSSAQKSSKTPPTVPEADGGPVGGVQSNSEVEQKFNSLRTLSDIFKVLAYSNGLVGSIGGAILLAEEAFVGAIGIWAATAFSVVICLVLAEGIGVVLAIEENTRRAANAAEQGP